MDSYLTFKIKRETGEKFRSFSKEVKKSQSEILDLMIQFFRNQGLSPTDDFAPDLLSFDKKISARINAVIAIIKEIEKTQTKPTLAMIQMLFQEQPTAKKEVLQEIKLASEPLLIVNKEDVEAEQHLQIKKQLRETREDIYKIIDKVIITRSSFGRPFLRLNLSQEEFEKLKAKFYT